MLSSPSLLRSTQLSTKWRFAWRIPLCRYCSSSCVSSIPYFFSSFSFCSCSSSIWITSLEEPKSNHSTRSKNCDPIQCHSESLGPFRIWLAEASGSFLTIGCCYCSSWSCSHKCYVYATTYCCSGVLSSLLLWTNIRNYLRSGTGSVYFCPWFPSSGTVCSCCQVLPSGILLSETKKVHWRSCIPSIKSVIWCCHESFWVCDSMEKCF